MRIERKRFCNWSIGCAFCFFQFASNIYAAVLTFDDIPGWPGSVIQDGYGGFQWSNFYIQDVFGVVTSPFAASNGYGTPASVRSFTPFYLGSAYVTPRFAFDMILRVRGYAGGTVLYDNDYYIIGAPRLVNFNYANIDRATFESVDPVGMFFVMDNLSLISTNTDCTYSISPTQNQHWPGSESGSVSVSTYAGCTWSVSNTNDWVMITSSSDNTNSGTVTYTVSSNLTTLPRTGFITIAGQEFSIRQFAVGGTNMADLGVIQSPTVGHRFVRFPFPSTMPSIVVDDLVSQRQDSGGGGVLPSVSANFDAHDKFTLTVSAQAGHKFLVRPPPGQAVRFAGGMDWRGNSTNGASQYGSLAVSFVDSEGIAPDFSASRTVLSDFHGVFGFNDIQSTAFTNELAFSSMTLTATVPSLSIGSGTLNYDPHADSVLGLFYRTSENVDPGPFVFIVTTQPTVNLTVQPNGDVTITFTGTLQSASDANGFTDVPSKPEGTYTITNASLSARQFFRARN